MSKTGVKEVMPYDIQTTRLPAALHRADHKDTQAGAVPGYGLGPREDGHDPDGHKGAEVRPVRRREGAGDRAEEGS